MDTFFFLSLGITFALILLLVYHFKQRLSVTEQKCDTMFEIINGMASELNSIKGFIMSRPVHSLPSHSLPSPNIQTVPLTDLFSRMSGGQMQHHGENTIDEVDNEDEDDEDDDEDDEDDDEDDDDDDFQVIEETNPHRIVVSDNDDAPNISESITLSVVDPSPAVFEAPLDSNHNIHKMTLANLKTYAVERGFVENASKMKKSELIELLEAH